MSHGHKRMLHVLAAIAGLSAEGVGSMTGYELWGCTSQDRALTTQECEKESSTQQPTMLIISVRSLASKTLTSCAGCSVVCSLEGVPALPGPP